EERAAENTVENKTTVPTDKMDAYYGCYQITQFCPTPYYKNFKYDWLPDQEADMMLGRIVILQPQRLVTYDSERRLGTREGRAGFADNYIIEEYTIETPQYTCQAVTSDEVGSSQKPDEDMESAIGASFYEQIENVITIPQLCSPFGTQYFYTLSDTDKLILYSTLSGQYFLMERVAQTKAEAPTPLSEAQKKQLLEDAYGVYEITQFLPTKYYPAKDSCGYDKLPKQEADIMLGKEIFIGKTIFNTYDNLRSPNSLITNRFARGFWVQKTEIENPEYRVECKLRKDLYGLRDDMLPEELAQQEYIEIDVYPGYEMTLPQLFLTENGKILLYAMGEYFLLEKKTQNMPETEISQDMTVKTKIHSDEEYAAFLEQLENAGGAYRSLYLDLCKTDTTVYLDDFLPYGIKSLDIINGGIICARDAASLNMDSLWRIRLSYIFSLQENLLDPFSGWELCIRLDSRYEGTLPTIELLENTDCETIILLWDSGSAPAAGGQNFYSILPEENWTLKGCCRVNQGRYSYTSFEFCAEDFDEVCAAFVCIRDHKNSDKTAVDILELPKSALPNISIYERRRIHFEDVNFDGYEDLIYVGDHSINQFYHQCTGFLWDNGKKRYQLCETLPSNFDRVDSKRKRLTYSASLGVYEDTYYYIYKYDKNRFVEERLELPKASGSVIWKYFRENELQKVLEVSDDADTYYIFYSENGTVREETLARAEYANVWEIGKQYFPEFDFYNFG
ncbi:MAG: hypothetical protein K2N90_11735, partial [Lachnospiraceae bacterium]|nr:hypothetical protein [Lachnospiraceae bacterium]